MILLVAAACGSSSPGPGTGGNGAGDLAVAAPIADLAPPPPDLTHAFMCGSTVCSGGTKCCVVNGAPTCSTSCPDGGFSAECKGPEDCSGNPCCITVGSGFTVQGVACTTSPSACPPAINPQTQSGMDRACHVSADCISGLPAMPQPSLPDCCTNVATGQRVCFNKNIPISGWNCQ